MSTVRQLLGDAVGIWIDGGWAMIALAVNSLILFAIGFNVWSRLRAMGHRSVPESRWRGWVAHPEKRTGPVGELLDFVMSARDVKEIGKRFEELRQTEVSPFDSDLKFMRRAVSTAPLLGLLGTVTGMLTTFGALASGSGGRKTMDLIAGGISEALITTETGLVIALPGLLFQYRLSRQREAYKTFLSHLETACMQAVVVWSRVREAASDPPRGGVPA